MSRLCTLALALLCGAMPAGADTVLVCFNYGCLNQAVVTFDDARMAQVHQLLAGADRADEERRRLSQAVGWLLGWAGEQSPIAADRGGNYADDGVFGRMDCIDHATTTTRLLHMLAKHGWLRFHRVLEPVLRSRYLFMAHYAAQIEELTEELTTSAMAAAAPGEPPRYVVDSWFRDNGQPAVVTDVPSWLAGAGDDEPFTTATGAPAQSARRRH